MRPSAESSDWNSKQFADREAMLVDAVTALRKYDSSIVKGFRAAYRRFLQDLDRILRDTTSSVAGITMNPALDASLSRLRKALYRAVLGIAREVMVQGLLQARQHLQLAFADEEESAQPVPQIPKEWYDWYAETLQHALWRYTLAEQERIARLTEKAIAEGWSIARLARQLKEAMGGDVYWRAERVARTETMRLFNLGYVGGLYSEPLVNAFTYAVVLDARTSHICRSLAGKWVPANMLVRVPPFHPNCRTMLVPVFGDEVQQLAQEDMVTESQQLAVAREFGTIPESVLAAWRRRSS